MCYSSYGVLLSCYVLSPDDVSDEVPTLIHGGAEKCRRELACKTTSKLCRGSSISGERVVIAMSKECIPELPCVSRRADLTVHLHPKPVSDSITQS